VSLRRLPEQLFLILLQRHLGGRLRTSHRKQRQTKQQTLQTCQSHSIILHDERRDFQSAPEPFAWSEKPHATSSMVTE
jgi:hypothetical protein